MENDIAEILNNTMKECPKIDKSELLYVLTRIANNKVITVEDAGRITDIFFSGNN